jgi:Zn-dependent protease
MLAFDKTGLALPVITAVLMHETAHLFTMWLIGCAPKEIRLIPSAVEIIGQTAKTPNHELLVLISGPAVNIILFLVLYFNYLAFGNILSLYYGAVNLIIGGFNLLPISALDGGSIFINLLTRKIDINKAMLILKVMTLIVATLILSLGIFIAINSRFNISFFIIGLYLIVVNLIKM